MDLQTIKDLITVIGFIILICNQNRTSQKDTEEKAANWAKVNMKLDTLCQSNTDIKDDLRSMKKENAAIINEISVIKEQIKVANHRIEDLERGIIK